MVELITLSMLSVINVQAQFTVATYNIWNIMFNWDIRKLRITQMITESDPDVIGFLEIRSDEFGTANQLNELQYALPQYEFKVYVPTNKVTPLPNSYHRGWEWEGLGVLSKHPIVNHTTFNMEYHFGSDSNRRIILHLVIQFGGSVGTIKFALSHFSYDRNEQCRNALDLLKLIAVSGKNFPTVIMGDFNTYKDFEDPMNLFGTGLTQESKCVDENSKSREEAERLFNVTFIDSWKWLYPTDAGFTFSNMPQPGLESRPDRVFTSPSLRPTSARLLGGTAYKRDFYYRVLWFRLTRIISTAWDHWAGRVGTPCLHDCGPHAFCRCGLCVDRNGVDSSEACQLPYCSECSSSLLLLCFGSLVVFLYLFSQLLYNAFRITNRRWAFSRRKMGFDCPFILTSNCQCLFYPFSIISPTFAVFVICIILMAFLHVLSSVLDQVINDILLIIPEELNSSDHLLLVVQMQRVTRQ